MRLFSTICIFWGLAGAIVIAAPAYAETTVLVCNYTWHMRDGDSVDGTPHRVTIDFDKQSVDAPDTYGHPAIAAAQITPDTISWTSTLFENQNITETATLDRTTGVLSGRVCSSGQNGAESCLAETATCHKGEKQF